MKVLSIGQSKYIISTLVESAPLDGTESTISEYVENGSGSACNVAYILGKYNVDSYIGSVIGDDTYGKSVQKELESVGVHTEYMETAYEKKTNFAVNLINKETKNNIILNYFKEKLLLKKSEFQMDPDAIYVDGYDYGASLSAFNKYSNKIKVIGAKVCSNEIIELCKYCDYIIASKEFAEFACGRKIDFDNPGSLVTVYSALLNKFVNKTIIITLGAKGTLYILNNQIKVMPSLNIDTQDNTGTGDFFRGAFIYALLQNYDLERAITFANIAGGLAALKIGTRESVPEISDVQSYFDQKYGNSSNETPVNGEQSENVANNNENTTVNVDNQTGNNAEPVNMENTNVVNPEVQANPTENQGVVTNEGTPTVESPVVNNEVQPEMSATPEVATPSVEVPVQENTTVNNEVQAEQVTPEVATPSVEAPVIAPEIQVPTQEENNNVSN